MLTVQKVLACKNRNMEFRNLFQSFTLKRLYSTQLVKNDAVIKLPVYVKEHIQRSKLKELDKRYKINRKIFYRGNTRIPVISSNVKEYNFYLGQIYHEQYPIPLISKHWLKQKSSGEKFKIIPWDSNPSLPVKLETEEEIENCKYPTEFSQFNLHESILKSLKENGYENTTPIQNISIPGILSHQHVICAAETGSGKTLGYLLPIFHRILEYKKCSEVLPYTPLALIIVPGRELAEQIAQVAFNLGQKCNVNVKILVSKGTKHEHLKPHVGERVDVLVASVGTLKKMHWSGIFKFGNLQHIVLDEADTLLDDSFTEDVMNFLKFIAVQQEPVENKAHGAQLISVSSTYPSNFNKMLPDDVLEDDIVKIKSPYLHRIQPHVLQRFFRVSSEGRPGELLDIVKPDFQKNIPVLVFCNKSYSCDWISDLLRSNDVPNETFHAGIDIIKRSDIFDAFQAGDVNVLCCTDLASRGLDTQRAQHVINYDFPNNVSDYILRAGRVGRVGTNHGRLTSLLCAKPGVYALQEVEMAVRKSNHIANVDANIKRKINKLYVTSY